VLKITQPQQIILHPRLQSLRKRPIRRNVIRQPSSNYKSINGR